MDKKERQKDNKTLNSLEEIKIYSDPYRLKIMKTFLDFGRTATVKEVADRLGEVPAKVYYHVKKLESIGLLWIDHTEVVNGIVAKYYRSFEGEIEIRSAEIEPELRGVYMSNVRRLVAEQFDETREAFLKQTDTNNPTRLVQNVLHMSKEEEKELFGRIRELLEPYERKRQGEGVLTYDFFLAVGANPEEASPADESRGESANDEQPAPESPKPAQKPAARTPRAKRGPK
ncbi:helix-turn-helix domain-containing protein [Saccharibacillus sp. CPCC 101409]|uniref:ArsR/SmtB family transcription factor n=1 Tax=Saccharibacillus sp. CPCC 101409 TaxID=3058041 RepID=UPI00267212B2|nr:helix-turn-helix domain-containing protein [Saccharibacillus sp. CPCC 101409]MDO3411699.1 helix-turn-helix domain-containing protein [Saccharibacillus sp. CPCC 101409]